MKNFVNIAVNALMASANSRATDFMRKQAQLIKPSNVDYRSNAGGWN